MLNNLNKRTWFTENTEVLTDSGWVDIESLSKIGQVITLYNNSLQGESLIEYNVGKITNSEILHYKHGDIYINAKYIHFPGNKIWRVDNELPIPKFETLSYSGKIYNLVTKSNTLITRTYNDYHSNNNDYTLSLCLAK